MIEHTTIDLRKTFARVVYFIEQMEQGKSKSAIQYKKYDDNNLDVAVKIAIASWEINRNRKPLENYMMAQQKMRETINKNNVDYLNTIL